MRWWEGGPSYVAFLHPEVLPDLVLVPRDFEPGEIKLLDGELTELPPSWRCGVAR
jgi:hypothetical protein